MAKCPYCGETLTANEEGVLLCAKCNKRFRRKETQAPTSAGEQASCKPDGAVAAQTASNHGETAKTESRPTQPAQIPAEENSQTAGTDVAADVTETTGSSAAATPVAGNTAEQDEIAQLRARIAAMEAKESERERGKRGSVLKKLDNTKFAPVVAFTKKWGLKAILPAVLVLIALITLLTCFCGLRGIYVNVDDPDEFFSFSATGYEWYYKLDGEQVLDKGKWSKSGNNLTLKYEDEWFGEVEESYQLKDFSWSSFTLYDSFFEEDKKFERVSVIGYKDSNKKATVTFYSNGGVGGGTHSLKIGSVLSSDETPTREGYLFMGWYTTPDGWKTGDGERFADNCRVWKDATYYANWKNAAQFTIRGDNLEQPLSFMENDNVENIFRSAMGWNTLPTGVLGVEFFDDEGNKVNSSAAPAANVTARVIYDVTVNNGTLTYVNPALTSYTVPSDVSHIAATAFANSKQLEKLYIAERQSELTVANGAFDACGKLDTVSGYAAKGMRAVVDACAGIKNLIVSDGVITTRTFENCSGLLSVTVGSGVTAVGDRAFADCTGLREIVWNTGLSSNLGQNVFANAGNDGAGVTVYFGGNATRAFNFFETTTSSQSPNVTAIVIGDNVTSIGYEAFRDCSSLRSVTIGNGVTSIGDYAFYGCSGLTSIAIPDSVTSIGELAFYSCSGLTSVYYTGDVAGWCGISGLGNIMSSGRTLYIDGEKVEGAIVIPDGITSIPSYAFAYQTGITSITIPDNVTSIGWYAFSGRSGLTSIHYTGDMQSWLGKNWHDEIMSSGRTLYIDGEKLEGAIVIPDGITSIPSYAFAYQTGITSITIPDSVTNIGWYAFEGCSGLTSITIPDSVTSIGSSAFSGCSGLTSVYYTGDVAGWCGISFDDYYANPLSNAHNLYIDDCLVTDLVIPDSVTSIGDYAFYNCSGLTSITIGDSVTSIGDYAFRDCKSLTSITIPDSVTSIGRSAFWGCSGLTSIYYTGDMQSWLGKNWHDEIMSSGRTLYIDGNKLEGAIVIPDGITSIPSYAFAYQTGITSITIPDSVTNIGWYAFYGCSGLTSINIPDSVTSIGWYAFYGCSGLTSVTFENTSGWQVSTSGSFSSYTSLSSSSLSNSSTAANYLKSTYCYRYWRRV